jgi:hypothetical protein
LNGNGAAGYANGSTSYTPESNGQYANGHSI